MKKVLIILTILLNLSFVACSKDNTSIKAVEDGKIALVSKEYDKAKDLFKLAVSEDSKNTDAKSLLDLTSNYIDLLAIIENGEFDKANDLISKIEKNNKLDIIKDVFIETKNNIIENKAKYDKYISEIESIEKLLSENKIDEAKSQATEKLKEVDGVKSLEDRLNAVITKVDEKIANAKAEILKYATDIKGIKYKSIITFDSNSGVFAEVKELKGKTMYHFYEDTDLSPKEYVYDEDTKDVFMLEEGAVFWISNGNIYVNEPKEASEETTSQNLISKNQAEVKISSEESRQIALNYYLNRHHNIKANEIFVGMGDDIEDNEYFRPIAGDDGDGNPGKVIAEYYVNATTGKVRVLWD